MSQYTRKADRSNEFPDREIEMTFYLANDISIDYIAILIFTMFKEHGDVYAIAASLPRISESKTKQLHYAKRNGNSDNTRLYVINIRDRDSFITIKRKGSKIYQKKVLIRDEQEEALPYTRWTQRQEDGTKGVEAERIGVNPTDIFLSKETNKRKLKIRIINTTTQRAYTVGLNEKQTTTGSIKKTIGIEYIGRESNEYIKIWDNNVLDDIADDIDNIGNIIRTICEKENIQFKADKKK